MERGTISCAIGSSLEWFDFALYGFFSPVLAKEFFSHVATGYMSLILVYLVFSIGFVARPIGGFIFGYIGDKYGRRASLLITPIGITITTSLMAVIPDYCALGKLSIYLLVLLRFSQGFFLGGEFTGNIVYLSESSIKFRYIIGSIASCTGSIGIFMASSVVSASYYFMNESFLVSNGWRLCFALSVPVGILILFLRLRMNESKEYLNISNNFKSVRFKDLIKKVLFCSGLISLHAVSFYFVFMFIPVFLDAIKHSSKYSSLIHNYWFLLLHILFIPIFSLGINKVGGRRAICFSAIIFIIFITTLFNLVISGKTQLVITSLIIFSLMTSLNAAIIPGLLVEILPVNIRYRVIGMAFNLAFGIFGGITPAVCLFLAKEFTSGYAPSYYIIIFAIITFVLGIACLRETNGARKIQTN